MIYTLTINPALDYIIEIQNFKLSNINRSEKEYIFPGGKGINVSIVLKELGIDLEMEQDAIDLIAKEGIDLEYGARPLKRAIQNHLENELSELILQRTIKTGDTVVASAKDDKMVFRVK